MGRLFRATHEQTGEIVALKVLRDELARNRAYGRRFEREANVAGEIRHPNLVPVVDAGIDTGRPYLAARFVDGPSLGARIRAEGALPLGAVVQIVGDVGAGLTALHRHGLVHRDVKPENVLLDPGGVALLTDFGLAKGPALTTLTALGVVVGTPQYLAPELVEGAGEASPASDVYSLGCLAFTCLAGAPPFTGSLMEVAYGHLDEDPPDPGAGRDDIPPGVSEVVLAALAKDPALRPRSPTMLAHLLRAGARGSA